MTRPDRPSDCAAWLGIAAASLRWGGWMIVLMCVYLRTMLGTEPFPYWDSDPTHMIVPITGLTPAWSLFVDALTIAASGAVLFGEAIAGAGVSLVWTVMVLIGSLGVTAHAFVLAGGSLEDARIGSTWVAAMVAGLAGMHACRNARIKRITLAASISIIAMFAAKGVVQVYVEHPMTVTQYRLNPDQFLASQGWSPGSAQARNFERRLNQPEATGWFGLANVYASFAAASLTALVGWAVIAWRRTRDPDQPLPDGWAGLLSLGALGAAGGLALAGSKGGVTAAGIGVALVAGGMLLARQQRGVLARILTHRAGGLLAIALMLSAIGALVLRGAVGERVGELSLLFRWFYVRGAVRIFTAHPLLGVGPAGFKDAYMLAKPPISPEEVQSPHSMMFDYAATLGLFGIAWVAVWLGWVYRLGSAIARVLGASPAPAAAESPGAVPEPGGLGEARIDMWAVLALASMPTLISVWVERPVYTADSAVARLVGLGAWMGLTAAALALMRLDGGWRWIAAVAALVLAVHAEIEVTPVWSGSAGLLMVIVASAGPECSPLGIRRRSAGLAAGLLALALAGTWVVAGLLPTARWERALTAGAAEVRPLADLATRLQAVAQPHGGPVDDSLPRIAADAAGLVGLPTPTTPREFDWVMATLNSRMTAAAAAHLIEAARITPDHIPTIEAICRIKAAGAVAEAALGHPDAAAALGEEATRWADTLIQGRATPSATAYGVAGNVWAARAEIEHRPDLLDNALAVWERAAALDPYGLAFPLRIFETNRRLGRQDAARFWAQRLTELDRLQRLDPLKGLTDAQRAEIGRTLNP